MHVFARIPIIFDAAEMDTNSSSPESSQEKIPGRRKKPLSSA
jgi:hypothetical protein